MPGNLLIACMHYSWLILFFFSFYVLTKPGEKGDQKDHEWNFGKSVFHSIPRRQEKLLCVHNAMQRTPAGIKHSFLDLLLNQSQHLENTNCSILNKHSHGYCHSNN